MTLSLTLMSSAIDGEPEGIRILPDEAHATWAHKIKLLGGQWSATFTLTSGDLVNYFYNWLGLHVRETSAGITSFAGIISKLDLQIGSFRRTLSFNDMWNNVAVRYEDTNGDTQITDYASESSSTDKYGTRETIEVSELELVTSTAAEQYRDDFLEKNSWPSVLTSGTRKANTLTVTVSGYVFALNWYYATSGSGTGNVSDRVSAISSAGDYVTTTYIVDENTSQVSNILEDDIRGWAAIKQLLEIGDGTDQFAFRVQDRTGYYEVLDTNPRYYVKNNKVYHTPTAANPVSGWQLQPGVYRDLDFSSNHYFPGALLTDPRDILVTEVEAKGDYEYTLR